MENEFALADRRVSSTASQAKRTVFVDKVGKDSRLWMTRRELSMNLKARLAQLQEPYIELTDFTVRCFLDMLFHLEQLHV